MPNGDLIVQFETYGDTPWGYGIARLDKDSNVVWRYLGRSHHDFDIAEDGRIYTLTHEMRNKRYDKLEQITIPRLDDAVTRSEEHTSELQSLMRNSYAVYCLKKKKTKKTKRKRTVTNRTHNKSNTHN